MSQSSTGIVLNIWPSKWGLPSIDPSCLAAVMYLQQAIPGKFSIAECSNPDLSPTGQLPFLTHEQHTVSSLHLITKYVDGLKYEDLPTSPNLDASLDHTEKSQTVAWCAHVESNLGDLVYHTLYSHHGNYAGLTHPTLVSMLPVPQRYYVPGRIRESYRPRLEAAGLWSLHTVDDNEKKTFKDPKETKLRTKEQNKKIFLQAFGREKVVEKARSWFDLYKRLLGEKDFIYRDRPTRLDIVLAAHILILLEPTYPDPFVQVLLKESYHTLVLHAHRVFAQSFASSNPPARADVEQRFLWSSLVPWPPTTRKELKATEEDTHFSRMRWGFFGLALGSFGLYMFVSLRMTMAYMRAKKLSGVYGEEREHEEEEED
ncbi:Metaxin-3 [Hypsizygus marmoreus]|uniref:Metaxin-3 n=1 Tax=Hypsizygus marmoreus TaxID=39966 RepID=A0A369JQS6_HYPMA|nr:Metaxin-3 [Hypsizygus marmoreus]